MLKKKITLAAFIAALLSMALLCGCGGSGETGGTEKKSGGLLSFASPKVAFTQQEVDPETTSLTIVLEPGETALLDQLPALTDADLSGSQCVSEIYDWAVAHPGVRVKYTVTLPGGVTLPNDASTADLSSLLSADAQTAADCLRALPKVTLIELGSQRDGFGWDDIALLQAARPEASINYSFTLYGQEAHLADVRLDLSYIAVSDEGEQVRQAMAFMPNLSYLDMDSCGVSNESMASIRDQYPEVKVVWRVWFGQNYSVRTDVERILASKPTSGGMLEVGNCESLMYCTDVLYLDIGHNETLRDISFVGYMTKLKVAILAMALWSDASCLANCPDLEYLELQTTNLKDLTPLAGLTKLRDLNICNCMELDDITPLYGLKNLERLWIGVWDPVPAEQVAAMREAVPGCLVNEYAYDPTEGAWRYSTWNEWTYTYGPCERYEEICKIFGDYQYKAFSFVWNDPLYRGEPVTPVDDLEGEDESYSEDYSGEDYSGEEDSGEIYEEPVA